MLRKVISLMVHLVMLLSNMMVWLKLAYFKLFLELHVTGLRHPLPRSLRQLRSCRVPLLQATLQG